MSSKLSKILSYVGVSKNNDKEVAFLLILVLFSLFIRVIPFSLITILFLVLFLGFLSMHFYYYVNKSAEEEHKNNKVTEFSWGFVKENRKLMDMFSFWNYIYSKDVNFLKKYIYSNIDKVVFLVFISADIIVAFKNLDTENAGIYIAMSIFTKFVFAAYLYMRQVYGKSLSKTGENNAEDEVLNIFYTQINVIISLFITLFIFFFILSKYIVDIFFGAGYAPYQSSLPFVLLANISLALASCIYYGAMKLDKKATQKISKIFFTLVFVLFIFMSVNYIDTVTYFIIGTSSLLSIFLYNFIIKKPEYIKRTYNLLF